VREAFTPLLGLPSWQVARGIGSFITLEFGRPEVIVHEPRMIGVQIENAPVEAMQRRTVVRGQWHLWIYCCAWSLSLDGMQLAHEESDDITMNRALRVLSGQSITEVSINPADASTTFTFDLGCVLTTTPTPGDVDDHEPEEQWLLYQPSHEVLAVRSDGRYKLCREDTSPDDALWVTMPATAESNISPVHPVATRPDLP